MKPNLIVMAILAIAACGGSKPPESPKAPDPDSEPDPKPTTSAKPAADDKDTKPEAEAAPEPAAPPPAKSWKAQAELTPMKGVKIKAATVTFSQDEGQPAAVAATGWFDGLKAGKYHLVVHQGAECGAKVNKPMTGDDIPFTVAKGTTSLDVAPVAAIQLDGDTAIVGHALVLHADAKGKPGKPMACGTISAGE